MGPYRVDLEHLGYSKEITDERDILKLKLIARFCEITSNMATNEILDLTGLHKSDLSRLRTFGMDRFTIDRLIGLLDSLGYVTKIDVKRKRAS